MPPRHSDLKRALLTHTLDYDPFIEGHFARATNFMALCGANVIMLRSKFRPNKALKVYHVGESTFKHIRASHYR